MPQVHQVIASFQKHCRLCVAPFALASLLLAGCGNQYRPVVSAINPVGPARQPTKYAVAISTTGANTAGLVNVVDFSGDNILDTTAIGLNPQYLILNSSGGVAFTLNGDGTISSFGISTALIASQVAQTTLLPNSSPLAILAEGTNLYVSESGNGGAVAQLTQGNPPTFRQQLSTGQNSVYTVGVASAPRVYAISQGNGITAGTADGIETGTNTISSSIPVGVNPVYGVMTSDARRAFILNKTSGTVSVINAQTNALDSFALSTSGTIAVGIAPVWADFAPTLAELFVVNQGNGSTPGSVSIISIPLCSANAITSNPNCDVNNPVDAVGFGQVIATVPVGINPVMIAVLQDGTQAFVANQGNAAAGIAGSVSAINLTTNTVTATLPATNSTNEADATVHGHPSFIAATTGDPTGKVYVTSSDSTDLTILRTDIDAIQTHLTLQGLGVQVRVSQP